MKFTIIKIMTAQKVAMIILKNNTDSNVLKVVASATF